VAATVASSAAGLEQLLFAGERVLWSGRARLGWRDILDVGAVAGAIFTIVVMAAFVAVLMGWLRHVSVGIGAGGFAWLGGFAEMWRRWRALYVVSDRRILVVTSAGRLMRAVNLGDLGHLRLRPRKDGRATLTFDLKAAAWGFRSLAQPTHGRLGKHLTLYGVEDGERLAAMVERQRYAVGQAGG
jgi:hypothetical protein